MNPLTEKQRHLAKAARDKLAAGQTPNAKEAAAWKKAGALATEKRLIAQIQEIPKGLYAEQVGRPIKVLNDQQDHHGIPLRGATVDLWAICRWMHDFLRDHKHALTRVRRQLEDADPLLTGTNSPALELYRQEKYRLARLERLERERVLVPLEAVRRGLADLAGMLRQAGEQIQREFGPQAQDILDETLIEFEQKAESYFASPDHAQD